MILLNIKFFFPNLNELSGGKVASLTKKEYGSAVHFIVNLNKIFKINI